MANLKWSELPFGYLKTDYNVRCYYRDGKWGELEISSSETVNLHISATALHYGQQAFEGMKAYRGKDGNIRLFRWEENFKRMERSANGILMQAITKDIFKNAIIKAVLLNERFVPPYGTGAALYLRPLLIGSGPQVGVKPAEEYMFMVFATPVGPYFKEGFTPIKIAIVRDSDRAAPLGTGSIKVGGNYASSLIGAKKAHDEGYGAPMYLDSVHKKYIDEIGAANFFGIKNNTYITPKSPSILPSITNMSIMQLAEDMGMTVERRPIDIDELDSFEEIGACGTAAIISPIGEIYDIDEDKKYNFCKNGTAGPVSTKIYERLVAIQYGDEADPHNWVEIIK